MITTEQIAHFQTFGFLALKQAFSPDEMAEIGRVFDNLLEKDRQGQPVLDEKQQSRYHRLQSIYGIAERHPTLTGLVADDRIYETVCQLLGHGCRWLCFEGHRYLGDTRWHPDGGSTQDYPFMVDFKTMHSQPPKSPTPLSRGARNRLLAIPPYHGGVRGTLETSLGSELLVNVYLFL